MRSCIAPVLLGCLSLAACDLVFSIDDGVRSDADPTAPDARLIDAATPMDGPSIDAGVADEDGDGILDFGDPCPGITNTFGGPDADKDGMPDACDPRMCTPSDTVFAFHGLAELPTIGWESSGSFDSNGDSLIATGTPSLLFTAFDAGVGHTIELGTRLGSGVVGWGVRMYPHDTSLNVWCDFKDLRPTINGIEVTPSIGGNGTTAQVMLIPTEVVTLRAIVIQGTAGTFSYVRCEVIQASGRESFSANFSGPDLTSNAYVGGAIELVGAEARWVTAYASTTGPEVFCVAPTDPALAR